MTKKLTEFELQKKIIYHERRANYYYYKLADIEAKKKLIGFKRYSL